MTLNPISRKSLTNIVAAELARSILDGTLKPGSRLPPERELMKRMGVSRSTVREALKSIEESQLLESQPGVGWFIKEIKAANIAKVRELAQSEKATRPDKPEGVRVEKSKGLQRLPTSPEKPLRIPNLQKDRLGTAQKNFFKY